MSRKIEVNHYGKSLPELPEELRALSKQIEALTRQAMYAGNRHTSVQSRLEDLEDEFDSQAVRLFGRERVLRAIDKTQGKL